MHDLVNCGLRVDCFTGMGAPKIAHAAYKGPSIMKEIFYGISLGLAAGFLWKMHHWSEQRKRKEFYDLLDAGRITTVVGEEDE